MSTGSYLIYLSNHDNIIGAGGEWDNNRNPEVVAFLHGSYQLVSRPPLLDHQTNLLRTIANISIVPFSRYSETDELAEFRLLNHKDRVIILPVENGSSILFGYEISKRQYATIDTNGMMVVRGPILINQNDQEQILPNASGHLTLNILGHAIIDLKNIYHENCRQVYLSPTGKNSFVADPKTIPYRFQQRTIVQRQRDMIQQNTNASLMSLETFEHLLC